MRFVALGVGPAFAGQELAVMRELGLSTSVRSTNDSGDSVNLTNPGGSIDPGNENFPEMARRFLRRRGDHVQRYRLAQRHGRGCSVLDSGCGHGLGAILLSPSCTDYTGVDADAEAIGWARRVIQPNLPRARFLLAEELARDERERQFDLVISFEVIEHVPNPREYLSDLLQRVRPGGTLLLSTPNGALSRNRPDLFMSPFHLSEFDLERLRSLMAPNFPTLYLYQRRLDLLDVIPTLIKTILVPGPADRTGPERPPVSIPESRLGKSTGLASILSRGYARYLQIMPSPPAAWAMLPLQPRHGDSRWFSHIIAIVTKRAN